METFMAVSDGPARDVEKTRKSFFVHCVSPVPFFSFLWSAAASALFAVAEIVAKI